MAENQEEVGAAVEIARRGFASGLVGRSVSASATVAQSVLAIHLLGTQEFGRAAVGTSVGLLASTFFGLQVGARASRSRRDDVKLLLGRAAFGGILVLVVVSALAFALILAKRQAGTLVLLAAAPAALRIPSSALVGRLAALGRPDLGAIGENSAPLVRLALSWPVLALAPSALAAMLIEATAVGVAFLVSYYLQPCLSWRELRPRRPDLKFVMVGLVLTVAASAGQLSWRIQMLFAGVVVGPSAAASLQLALQAGESIAALYSASLAGFTPAIAAARSTEERHDIYARFGLLTSALFVSPVVIVAFLGGEILKLLLSTDEAVSLAVLLIAARIGFQVWSGPGGLYALSRRNDRLLASSSLRALGITTGLSALLLWAGFGIGGVCVGAFLGFAIQQAVLALSADERCHAAVAANGRQPSSALPLAVLLTGSTLLAGFFLELQNASIHSRVATAVVLSGAGTAGVVAYYRWAPSSFRKDSARP